MTGLTLYSLTEEYVEAARQLTALAEAGDLDPQAVADTLDGIRGALEVKAVNVAAYSRHLDAQAGVIDTEIDRLRRYKATVERQSEALRHYLSDQMVRAGITKIEAVEGAPPFRLAIRKNPPQVVIDNEDQLPWEFRRERVVTEIDRAAIKDAIKDNAEYMVNLAFSSNTVTFRSYLPVFYKCVQSLSLPSRIPTVASPEASRNIAERLNALERLKDKGLISDIEYEKKRKQILDEL